MNDIKQFSILVTDRKTVQHRAVFGKYLNFRAGFLVFNQHLAPFCIVDRIY